MIYHKIFLYVRYTQLTNLKNTFSIIRLKFKYSKIC